MSDNPWVCLPVGPPYVLAQDEDAVRKFNEHAGELHQLRIDELLPEPFVGDPAAPVLLLSNNPGFGKHAIHRQNAQFMARMCAALGLDFSTYLFIYLDPENHKASGWWRQKLKCLLTKFGDEVVAKSVCNVAYIPYPSSGFRHGRCEVPSQQFSFRLVREAVERGAVVVLMRKGRLRRWQERVPELRDYDNLVLLRNPQMPSVSAKNCDAGDYERIVDAIKQAEAK